MEDHSFPEHVNQFFMAVIVAIQQYLGSNELVPELLRQFIGTTVIDQIEGSTFYTISLKIGPFQAPNEDNGWEFMILPSMCHVESGRMMYSHLFALTIPKSMSEDEFTDGVEKAALAVAQQYLRVWYKP